MRQDITETNDALVIADLREYFWCESTQSIQRIANYLKLAFYRRTKQSISSVIGELFTGCELGNPFNRSIDVIEQRFNFHLHRLEPCRFRPLAGNRDCL
jgi:hypothetical protein